MRARLSRAALAAAGRPVPPAPPRIVHLGLGAFHRAHQAWYTARAEDAAEWGIVAFTGRTPDVAARLTPQDGLYRLIERGEERDRTEIVPSIVAAVDGARTDRLAAAFREPGLAIVTLTITEAGYRLGPDGLPDDADTVLQQDLETLRSDPDAEAPRLGSVLGRLLLGLLARRAAGGGPLAIVPCDNIPDNGAFVRRGLLAAAARVDPSFAAWAEERLSFVSTSVDRITPATTEADIERLNATAEWVDRAPVVTEPFTDWVLSGSFPAGRPAWESAGARFVDAIAPWERRKLWLLNGAHTLLSFAGPLRGRSTVAEAVADPVLAGWMQDFWDEAVRHLPPGLDLEAYRAALLERFGNPRIEHRLAQIAKGGTVKLALRVLPVAEAERRAGRPATACARAVAAWLIAGRGASIDDGWAQAALAELAPALADDAEFLALVLRFAREFPTT